VNSINNSPWYRARHCITFPWALHPAIQRGYYIQPSHRMYWSQWPKSPVGTLTCMMTFKD